MNEKHKLGKDGLLEDGVPYYPADAHDMRTFEDAKRDLAKFSAPLLVHADNSHERLYIATFDGTGNDALNDPEHATNVAKLRQQIMQLNKAGNGHIKADYVEGPGTQDNLIDRTWDGMRGYTYDARIEQMYKLFIEQGKEWRNEDPNAQIRIANIGFSRGAEQAAGFARLVHERGIQDFSGANYTYDSSGQITHVTYSKPAIVAPGQVAQVVGLFDPVGTGVPVNDKDRRLPPSVISGFQLIAEDERRGLFKSTHIIDPGMTPDGRFLGVIVAGAHSDVGGSYHRDGLGIRSGNLMIDYLNALSDQPYLGKTAEPDDPRRNVVHRSEEGMLLYQVGEKVDRLKPEGYEERLVPKDHVNKVPDAYNAEPLDEALNQQFERRNVPVEPVAVERLPAYQHHVPSIGLQTDAPIAQTVRGTITHPAHAQALPPAFQNVLRHDDRGHEVGALQQQLRSLGYTDARGRPLAVDGHFGPITHTAVRAFQREHGLVVDGVVDLTTREALHRHTQHRRAPVAEHSHHAPVTASPVPTQATPQAGVPSSQQHVDETARAAQQASIDRQIAHWQRIAEEKEAAQRTAHVHTAQGHEAAPRSPEAVLPFSTAATAMWTPEPLPPPRVPATFADPDHPKHYRYQVLLEQVQEAPALQGYTAEQHQRIAAGLTYVTDPHKAFVIQGLGSIEVKGSTLTVTDRLKIGEASEVLHGNLDTMLAKTPQETASAWREWALPKQAATAHAVASADPQPVSRTDVRHPQEPHHAMFRDVRQALGAAYARHGMTRDPLQLDREAALVTVTLRDRQIKEVPMLVLACEPDGRFSTQPGLRAVNEFTAVKLSGEALQQAPPVEQSSQALVQVEQRLHQQAIAFEQRLAQQAGLGRTR